MRYIFMLTSEASHLQCLAHDLDVTVAGTTSASAASDRNTNSGTRQVPAEQKVPMRGQGQVSGDTHQNTAGISGLA